MFVVINKDTLKKGSFHATLDDASEKLKKLGSVGSKFYIVDIGDEAYETFEVTSAVKVESQVEETKKDDE